MHVYTQRRGGEIQGNNVALHRSERGSKSVCGSSYRRHVYYRDVIKWPGAQPSPSYQRPPLSVSLRARASLIPVPGCHCCCSPPGPGPGPGAGLPYQHLHVDSRHEAGGRSYGAAFIRVICHTVRCRGAEIGEHLTLFYPRSRPCPERAHPLRV